MKYKISLLLVSLFTFSAHATLSNTSPTNPFNKAWSHRTGGIAAAIFHGKMGAGITKWKGKAYSWEELIQGGFFFNALYLRILLSEFYCGRCAVGASPFTNSALAQQAAPASFPTLSSTNQPKSPGLLPGGFDAKVINTFFNTGKGYVQSLQTVRKQLAPLNDYANNTKFGTNKPSGKIPAPNPLTTFAGIIIVPTKNFVKNLGPININNGQLFTEPRFFPYKNPLGTPTVISNPSTSSNASSTSLSVVTTPKAVTSKTKGNTNDPTSLTMNLNASLKNHPVNSLFCNLSLSAWKSTANRNGKPLPIRLKNLNLSVLGQEIPITVYDGWSPLTKNATSLGHFFKYAPSNPWAIVIEIDGNLGAPSPTTGKRPINTQPRILGLVQLNPLEFSSIKNLSSLLNMPQNLYYSIQNTYDGLTDSQISQRTPTARLLRGIANGYLTSWNYKPLPNGSKTSDLMAWENAYNGISYPTPTGLQFLENSDWAMFYGLYGCRQALKRMHIQQSAIKSIQSIIKNPKKTIPGYVGAGTSLLYQPVNTVLQNMGGIPTPKFNLTELQTAFITILAVKNVSTGQYTKLINAQKALNNFIVAAQKKNPATLKTNLKSLMSKLRGAGGGLAWPYPSNKALNLPASKTFITAEESFRKVAKILLQQSDSFLKTYLESLTLPPVQTIRHRPKPTVHHRATPAVHHHVNPTPPVHHKVNPATIVHHKANPKHGSSTKSPKPLTSSTSIKAYKSGYKAGLIDSKNNTQRKPRKNSSAAIKAYKAGYKDGLTAAQY